MPEAIRVQAEAAPDLSVVVKHSILRDDEWDWVTEKNAASVLADLPDADVVVCAHTHRPAIHAVAQSGSSSRRVDVEACGDARTLIRTGVRYVVDAGSTSRAERLERPRIGEYKPFDRGSYAVIDFARRTASVRSFAKPAAV